MMRATTGRRKTAKASLIRPIKCYKRTLINAFTYMLMTLVLAGAFITWFLFMGGKDFLWSMIKLILGEELPRKVVPEKEDIANEVLQEKGAEIVRKSEPIRKNQSMIEMAREIRPPANALLAKRIQPRI